MTRCTWPRHITPPRHAPLLEPAPPPWSSPQHAPAPALPRRISRARARPLHAHPMDLDRTFYLSPPPRPHPAARSRPGRTPDGTHGVRPLHFLHADQDLTRTYSASSVAREIPRWTASLGKTFRTQIFFGVCLPPIPTSHPVLDTSPSPLSQRTRYSSITNYGPSTTRPCTISSATPKRGGNLRCCVKPWAGTCVRA